MGELANSTPARPHGGGGSWADIRSHRVRLVAPHTAEVASFFKWVNQKRPRKEGVFMREKQCLFERQFAHRQRTFGGAEHPQHFAAAEFFHLRLHFLELFEQAVHFRHIHARPCGNAAFA